MLFVILILILAVTINHNTKDLAKSTEFLFKDDKICKKIKQENLSTLNKIGAYRNEAKYGAKINQSINKKDILHTIIKDHEIEIEAIDSNTEILKYYITFISSSKSCKNSFLKYTASFTFIFPA